MLLPRRGSKVAMLAYAGRCLLQMIAVLILVTMLAFSLLLMLPGDPVRAVVGMGVELTPDQLEAMRHELGLDRPIPVQYAMWLGRVLRGDLGRSAKTHIRITEELKARLPVTLQLGFIAWLFSILIAIPAGVVSAVYRGSKADLFATIITIGGVAIPGFWLGMALILVLSVWLGWLPPFGFVSLFDDPIEGLKRLAMPAFSLGLSAAALNMRQMRSSMLEVMNQDYIRTATAKGLRRRRIIWVHALKNALLPVVTVMGVQIGRLFGGAVVIETLFAIPGMGRLMVSSILSRDFPVVQACVLVIAVTVLLANFATDLLYGYLDPRIRIGKARN